MILEFSEIRRLLPHGYPVALVDRVLSLESRSSIVAIKAICGSELCYRDVPAGASAADYAYPVSLMMESLVQAVALLWLAGAPSNGDRAEQVLMLGAVRGYRCEGRAFPGDIITHKARIEKATSGNVAASGESWSRPGACRRRPSP